MPISYTTMHNSGSQTKPVGKQKGHSLVKERMQGPCRTALGNLPVLGLQRIFFPHKDVLSCF